MRISDWSSDVCSSDLGAGGIRPVGRTLSHRGRDGARRQAGRHQLAVHADQEVRSGGFRGVPEAAAGERSEEHTSELQSLMRISYAVFCLKKKKNTKTTHYMHNLITKSTIQSYH